MNNDKQRILLFKVAGKLHSTMLQKKLRDI